jgi:hypothetical protein
LEKLEVVKVDSKKQIKLRLEFIHKPINKRWYEKKHPFLVQNEPFEYGLKIKNIGNEPFSGATIGTFLIEAGSVGQPSTQQVKIKALNPNESYELYFDKYTLWHEGSISTRCSLIPDKENEEILTYQHHRDHDIDEEYKEKNEWWHDYYCQGQQQLLQTKTNNLILFLTSITVIEAIFGLKDTVKFFASILAWLFNELYILFAWLAS